MSTEEQQRLGKIASTRPDLFSEPPSNIQIDIAWHYSRTLEKLSIAAFYGEWNAFRRMLKVIEAEAGYLIKEDGGQYWKDLKDYDDKTKELLKSKSKEDSEGVSDYDRFRESRDINRLISSLKFLTMVFYRRNALPKAEIKGEFSSKTQQ